MIKKIIFFNHINKKDKYLVGNKAFNLGLLRDQGINIAPFFVVTTSVFHELIKSKNNLNKIELPQDLKTAILKNFKKLKTNKLAIRSSATCEDGENSSFAGQFASFLSVPTNKIIENIKKCWASVFTAQVRNYCYFHKIDPSLIKMAVMVQKMVKAQKGGVIFTKDITGNGNRVIIEAAKGLGEKVVSGLVDPQKLVFSKKTKKLSEGSIGFQNQVLNFNEAFRLFKISLKIEKIFGRPQDIEWAIEKGKIYILQSRPIT